MTALSTKENFRLKLLEDTIKKGAYTFIEVGNALLEIRDNLLWRDSYQCFDHYCEKRWGWGRKRSEQLMRAAAVVQGLPKKLETIVSNEGTARELVKVPAEKRNEVVEKAKDRGVPVTARVIREVVAEVLPAQKNGKHEILKDDTGYPIPEKIMDTWNRRQEVQDLLTAASRIKTTIEEAFKNDDRLYTAEINKATILSDIGRVYTQLTKAKPCVVCPSCQGKLAEKCQTCRGRGLISDFKYDTQIDKDLKKLRESTIKKVASK